MKAEVARTDDLGVYFLFTEDTYSVEEFHTYEDLQAQGWDGTDPSLIGFLKQRIDYRKQEQGYLERKVSPPEPPTIGFEVS